MNVPSHVRRVAAAGRVAVCLSVSLLCVQAPGAAPAIAASSSAEARDLADTARSVGRGETLRIEGVQLDGEQGLTGLELTRLEVLAEGARFVAQTDAGPRPL
ncbi:MAG: hypothetical protein HY899_13080, partial [Deltaproteobacteria bacterium]|nr:hypothetical protein [Deltaproteobacteria bacterium]